jgi:hypothetical protein
MGLPQYEATASCFTAAGASFLGKLQLNSNKPRVIDYT